jgi:redox-sensitive bicupin YhaK (pirin superfamily)
MSGAERNFFSDHKRKDPRYRGVTKDQILGVRVRKRVAVGAVCGEIEGTKGPVIWSRHVHSVYIPLGFVLFAA